MIRNLWRAAKRTEEGIGVGFLVLGVLGVLAVLVVVALLVGTYGGAVTAAFTPETVGQRLRRECESIVLGAYPGTGFTASGRHYFYPDGDQLVSRCIYERGMAGRP